MSGEDTSVTGYKTFLRDCLDRRPSGLRQKLAGALGKHKSFISQITSPAYSVPIPAGDLPTIFDVCHLSTEEQERFLRLYERAHPGRSERARHAMNRSNEMLRIAMPAFRFQATQREVEAAILEAATRIIRVAQNAEERGGADAAGAGHEKVRQSGR